MNKKRLIAVIVAAVIFAVAVGVLYMQFGYERLVKTVSVRGYEICVPEKWSSDSKGNLYDKDGDLVAMFTLVDKDEETVGKEIAENVVKNHTQIDGKSVTTYYITDLPNPEPYAANLTFYRDKVKDRLAQKIYESFRVPAIGKKPPKKHIEATPLGDIGDDKICRVEFADGTVTVKNMEILNAFADRQREKQSAGADVISYKEAGDEFVVDSWYYIESDGGTGYMYTYYEEADGRYTYDNNPLIFEGITKEAKEEKETTWYRLTSGGVNTTVLLELPLNLYRDNAEELIALKTKNATETQIQGILNKIKTTKELNSLTFKVSANALLITYDEGIAPDRAKAYSDAAVLFGLAENLDSITFAYSDGTEYTFTRKQIEKSLDVNMSDVAEDRENFVDYTEKIEENKQSQTKDGDVVYSATVTVYYDTVTTHPDTGEKVKVGPYAEKKGYAQYLGKPVYCEIRRLGSGYIASASCGGNPIGSYPLNSEAELQSAISLLKAYS